MTDFGPLLAPAPCCWAAAAQFGYLRHRAQALTLNYFGIISFTLPQAAGIRHHRRRRRPTITTSGKLAPERWGHRGGGLLRRWCR
jgi:oxaloacetate decarboxylase beta subunit